MKRAPSLIVSLVVVCALGVGIADAAPVLNVSGYVIELVATDPVALAAVDGLAFDAFGNLFAARELGSAAGGVSYVDHLLGTASVLVSGILRADQVSLHPSGALFVTSEIQPAATTDRVYRVDLIYDGSNRPIGGVATPIDTSPDAINNPEGLVALPSDSAFGLTGDLYVAEDRGPGRILRVRPSGNSGTVTVLASGLQRPEGIDFGDLAGGLPQALLFVAETSLDRVVTIDALGVVTTFGDPTAVGLDLPDNVRVGPDGFLYVTEDKAGGRLIRIAADGTHTVFASGFAFPQGLAFDPATGDLYISEQGTSTIWRVRAVPEPGSLALVALAGLGVCLRRRRPVVQTR